MSRMLDAMLNWHRSLTAVSPLAGTRQFGSGGQTASELALAASFSQALQEPLRRLYQWPFRNGVDAVPDTTDRAELEAWLREQYEDEESGRLLRIVLAVYLVRAFALGGQFALEAMGILGLFVLSNRLLLDSIAGFANDLVDLGGEMSLTNTTAVELAAEIERQRVSGVELALGLFITGRVLARARLIAGNEMVRLSRLGLAHTFWRNGVQRVRFRTAPELSATGPCPICRPLDGNVYRLRNGRVDGPDIPVHVLCVCYYDPVLDGWAAPEEVWRGG